MRTLKIDPKFWIYVRVSLVTVPPHLGIKLKNFLGLSRTIASLMEAIANDLEKKIPERFSQEYQFHNYSDGNSPYKSSTFTIKICGKKPIRKIENAILKTLAKYKGYFEIDSFDLKVSIKGDPSPQPHDYSSENNFSSKEYEEFLDTN